MQRHTLAHVLKQRDQTRYVALERPSQVHGLKVRGGRFPTSPLMGVSSLDRFRSTVSVISVCVCCGSCARFTLLLVGHMMLVKYHGISPRAVPEARSGTWDKEGKGRFITHIRRVSGYGPGSPVWNPGIGYNDTWKTIKELGISKF